MDLENLIFAIGIILVFEGVAYVAFPGALKRALGQLQGLSDNNLRFLGFVALFLGFVVIWFNWG